MKNLGIKLDIVSELLWLYDRLCDKSGRLEWVTEEKQKTAYTLFKNEVFVFLLKKGFISKDIEIIQDAHKYILKKDKTKIAAQKRRHDKRKEFSLNQIEWDETKFYFGYECSYCGNSDKLTFDHFIPLSKGGAFAKNNILPACTRCNSSKHNHDFNDWYKKQEYYDRERENKIYAFLENANKY